VDVGVGIEGRSGHQLLHRLPGEPCQHAAQLAPAEGQRPQHLGNGEDPLRVPDVLEDVVDEERGELRAALGGAGRAQLALLAGEGDEHLVAALPAAHARKATLPDAAVEIARDRLVPAPLLEAIAGLEPLLPAQLDGLEERLEQPVERCLLRTPGPVDPRAALHAATTAGGRQTGTGPSRGRGVKRDLGVYGGRREGSGPGLGPRMLPGRVA